MLIVTSANRIKEHSGTVLMALIYRYNTQKLRDRGRANPYKL